jgi:hypothetical protein
VFENGATGTISNTSIVAVGSNGKIQAKASSSVILLLDVQGYYTAGDPTAGGYVPVTPKRIVNTTNGTGLPLAKLAAGSTTPIQVSGGLSGVPEGASAVFVNLTPINYSTTTDGFLTPFPTGTTRPTTSLNFPRDIATAIGATVDLNDTGQFSLYEANPTGAFDISIDVLGYFTTGSGAGSFTPASTRVYDSRTTTPHVQLASGATAAIQSAGVAGVPVASSGISAIAINLQVIAATTAHGYLRAWPTGEAEPTSTSSLNFGDSDTRSNLTILAPSSDGKISLHNVSTGPIDFVFDVEGWYTTTRPATPAIASTSLTDGSTTPSPASPVVFTFQSTPLSAVDSLPVSYRYWVDDSETATVAASSATITIPAAADGVHDLLVTAVDAAGAESDATDFSWLVGDGQLPPGQSPTANGPSLATLTTTATTDTTNDDGTITTTTDSTTASTPSQDTISPFNDSIASQLSGPFAIPFKNTPDAGGPTYPTLSCAKERVLWLKTTYAQLHLRYNCHYGRGTVNWDQKLAPAPLGVVTSPVYEDGMRWTRWGPLGTVTKQMNARHNDPLIGIGYLFHGSVDTPATPTDLVIASDYFTYSWYSARQHGTVKITLWWACILSK